MKKSAFNLLHICAVLLVLASTASAQELAAGHGGRPEPPMAGIHWAKGQGPNNGAKTTGSPNLIWHGGDVMTSVQTQVILWGAGWADTSFIQDKINGLDLWYSTVGGSSYIQTNHEYTAGNGQVTKTVGYSGHLVDLSAAPPRAPKTSDILGEVCKMISDPQPNGYYAVYVDTPRGHAGYCAWHSAGTCGNGNTIQFAFFFNLDGDPGCDPGDTSGLHSQGMAALGNVTGHELSEAMTDPHLDAWYDSGGAENADKCAWSFGTDLLSFSGKSKWKIQGNWSNAAYSAGTGYANRGGLTGCLDGGNYK